MLAFFGWLLLTKKETYPSIFLPYQTESKPVHKKWFTSRAPLSSQSLSSPFGLEAKSYTLTLPDLREEILYYGRNMRPDFKENKPLFFIGLEGQEVLITIEENKPLYLQYQPSHVQDCLHENSRRESCYSFSPKNQPTPLWIEAKSLKNENQVQINLFLIDENNTPVQGIKELSTFCLNIKSLKLSPSSHWEIGKCRVDPTFLIRQKARFIGEDVFLKKHGGQEYASIDGHCRIDFMSSELPYSCFVQENDFLVWDDERWHVVDSRTITNQKPLLVIKKIDERMMYLDLWNEIGSQKLALTLVRSKDHHTLPNMASEFQFIQAKTWTQFIVECRGEKMTLRPNDWLLLTEQGWQLMTTVEQIDNYVTQQTQGPLFVVGKLKKEEGGQVLLGHLFNSTRSEMIEVKLEQKKASFPSQTIKSVPLTQVPPLFPSQLEQVSHSMRGNYYEN